MEKISVLFLTFVTLAIIIERLQDCETFTFNPEAYPHLLFSSKTWYNHMS